MEDIPQENETAMPLGRHLDGCRIGFDLGGSDRKCAAVIDRRGGVLRGGGVESRILKMIRAIRLKASTTPLSVRQRTCHVLMPLVAAPQECMLTMRCG